MKSMAIPMLRNHKRSAPLFMEGNYLFRYTIKCIHRNGKYDQLSDRNNSHFCINSMVQFISMAMLSMLGIGVLVILSFPAYASSFSGCVSLTLPWKRNLKKTTAKTVKLSKQHSLNTASMRTIMKIMTKFDGIKGQEFLDVEEDPMEITLIFKDNRFLFVKIENGNLITESVPE